MTKPTQYLLVGFPYSGKSTLAKELVTKLGFKHINIDQLKFDKGYTDVGDDDVPDLAWNEIFDNADGLIVKYLKEGKNIANEYAWITKEWRDRARKVASDAGFETKVIYIKVPKQQLWSRWQENAETKKRFQWPKIEFERNFKDFEEPTTDEKRNSFRSKYLDARFCKRDFKKFMTTTERHKIKAAVYLLPIKGNKVLLSRRFNTGWKDGWYSFNFGTP